MAIFPGDLGGIGIGAETVYGTGVPAGSWLQAKPGSNMGKQQGIDAPDALTVTKLTSKLRGRWASGSFSFIPNYLNATALRVLLEHVFGSETGTGPYTYAISDPSSQASMSIWKDLGGRVERMLGAKATSFEWVIGQGFSEVSVDIVAQDVDHPAAVTISHSAAASLVHSNDLSAFTIDGTSYIAAIREIRFRMEIPHTGEERLFLGATNIAEPQRSGPRAITVQAQLELSDATPDVTALTDDWEAGNQVGTMAATLTSGSRSFNLIASNVQPLGDPMTLDPGPTVFNMSGEADDLSIAWDETV